MSALKLTVAAAMIVMADFPSHAEALNAIVVSKSKKATSDSLHNPSSAKFRDVRVTGNCNGIKYVTGSVSEKNGYARFTVFLVRIEGDNAVAMQSDGRTFPMNDEFHIAAVCNGNAPKQ